MTKFQDAAYAHAALSATLVMLRVLINQGLVPRDDVVRAMLDGAVSTATAEEGERHRGRRRQNGAGHHRPGGGNPEIHRRETLPRAPLPRPARQRTRCSG